MNGFKPVFCEVLGPRVGLQGKGCLNRSSSARAICLDHTAVYEEEYSAASNIFGVLLRRLLCNGQSSSSCTFARFNLTTSRRVSRVPGDKIETQKGYVAW